MHVTLMISLSLPAGARGNLSDTLIGAARPVAHTFVGRVHLRVFITICFFTTNAFIDFACITTRLFIANAFIDFAFMHFAFIAIDFAFIDNAFIHFAFIAIDFDAFDAGMVPTALRNRSMGVGLAYYSLTQMRCGKKQIDIENDNATIDKC